MESTVSVSKGVFLFSNGFNKQNPKKKSRSLFEKLFIKEPWYTTYKRNWHVIENQIKDLHHRTYSLLLNDMVNYMKSFSSDSDFTALDCIIPSATLLTGVNQPDHMSQFTSLIEKTRNLMFHDLRSSGLGCALISKSVSPDFVDSVKGTSVEREEVTPHIAMVNSQDAPTLKHLIENAVWQWINGLQVLDDSASDDFDEIASQSTKKLKKNQCTMKTLLNWYNAKYNNSSSKKRNHGVYSRSLVIIIPDFESFNCNVLQDFVMIVSSYISSLPIMFVFGVATSVSALHKSFPYNVSSKLLIKVFHTHSSSVYMNQVLEDIFLTYTSPLHFSGKAFELLTDVFLFYDFSVTGLVHSIKYCMMDHYYGENMKSLCCERDRVEEVIMNLSMEDLQSIRHLISFRSFLEAQDVAIQIKLFENDNFFRDVLYKEINKFHDYLYSFYTCLRLLTILVKDLPRNGLGKSTREIYTKCTVDNIADTQAFEECMQLLNFQSQVKLVECIKTALKLINSVLKVVSPPRPLRSTPSKNNLSNINLSDDLGDSFLKAVRVHLLLFLRQIEYSNTEATSVTNTPAFDENDMENIPGNRYKLKEKLLRATRVEKVQSEFEMVRSRFVSYLKEMFAKGLRPPRTRAFHELFFFGDVGGVKKQIVGSPRGALHMALSNPVHYLQCSCCHLPSPESIAGTLPDVCLAYKLHRECGKHINLYDWLQAFAAVLRPGADDDTRHQDTSVQVRFTRAVAELQFLGFIKSSKRKTDHVMRLTW